jgi:hypothetical protein
MSFKGDYIFFPTKLKLENDGACSNPAIIETHAALLARELIG